MSQPRNKVEFTVTVDGKEIPLVAVRPDQSVRQAAELVRSKAWGEAAQKGITLEAKLKDLIRQQGLWDDEKQAELDAIDKRISDNERKLPDANGKVRVPGLKKSDIRQAAIQMRRDRGRRVELLEPVTSLKNNTAEGHAENARFNFMLTKCVLRRDWGRGDQPYFGSVEEFLERGRDADAAVCAEKFAELYYGTDPNWLQQLPENQFLVKYGLADPETLELLLDGKAVNADGTLVEPEAVGPAPEFDFEDDLPAGTVSPPPPAPPAASEHNDAPPG